MDKNSDGVVDLVDCSDFNKLLQKHQKKIIEVEKKYVQNFVKISIYLKKGKAKLEIALARGKKLYDHRDTLKKKDLNRQTDRELKE